MLSNLSRNSLKCENASSLATPKTCRRLEVVSKQATKVTAISAKLEWRIDQFEKLMKLFKNGHNLISKQFSCPQAPSVIWELHVYPNGKRDEDNNNVSFFLRQVGLQRGEDPIMTEFQIYTLDANNCRISVCRDTKDFSNQQGRGKFQVQRDKIMAALRTDGSLMLICEVEYLPPGSKISVEQEEECEIVDEWTNKNELSVRDSMREMFESELFADCTIQVQIAKCGMKTFNVHRCILGQHSQVFRSMFGQTSMLEAQNGVIQITDFRPESVRAMLEFIYTGSISPGIIENFSQAILAIADKYAIFPLKELCERYLAFTICKKNVASMAVIADMYCASFLKKACTRFISSHHKEIMRSPEWKELKNSRSELANELLESVLNDHASNDLNCGNVGEIEDSLDVCESTMSGISCSTSILNVFSSGAMNSTSSFTCESSNSLSNNPLPSSNYSSGSGLASSLLINNNTSSSGSNVNSYLKSSVNQPSSASTPTSTLSGRGDGSLQNPVVMAPEAASILAMQREVRSGQEYNTTADEQTPFIRKRIRRGGVAVSTSVATNRTSSSNYGING